MYVLIVKNTDKYFDSVNFSKMSDYVLRMYFQKTPSNLTV